MSYCVKYVFLTGHSILASQSEKNAQHNTTTCELLSANTILQSIRMEIFVEPDKSDWMINLPDFVKDNIIQSRYPIQQVLRQDVASVMAT